MSFVVTLVREGMLGKKQDMKAFEYLSAFGMVLIINT